MNARVAYLVPHSSSAEGGDSIHEKLGQRLQLLVSHVATQRIHLLSFPQECVRVDG